MLDLGVIERIVIWIRVKGPTHTSLGHRPRYA
jgi:hypothetical protein